MHIYNSEQWMKDIYEVSYNLSELEALAGKSIMITGAAGLICSSVVDILLQYNETHKAPIKIFAAGRSIEKIRERFGPSCNKEYFKFIKYDALKSDNLEVLADYVIHGAGNAFPRMIVEEPVETMISNFCGMFHLLNAAKIHKTNRILYLSSSEVYGERKEKHPYQEKDYGYIDILNPRNAYSMGKRATETLCISYAYEFDTEVVIVRPGHIYGPTASLKDDRVSSSFAYAAACGKDIVLKSDGAQVRSYTYCLDCAAAILKVLVKGKNLHAYNISNPDSIISIKQMAEILAKASGVSLIQEEANETEKKGFNPMSNSSLDGTKLMNLGWKSCFNAEKGLAHTVKILKEMKEKN